MMHFAKIESSSCCVAFFSNLQFVDNVAFFKASLSLARKRRFTSSPSVLYFICYTVIMGSFKTHRLWKGAAKGSAKDPASYRGLQVGSSLCKIMIIIILNRLKNWYDEQLLDQHQGFQRGRGTADGIYVTKRLQKISGRIQKAILSYRD